VGALSSVRLGWFSWESKQYEPSVTLDEQLELLSLIGDVAVKSGKPVVHAHAVIGRMIYSPAKTVADCFKFRNKIGLDVALEGLRECVRQRKATIAEIRRFAEICRVARVIQPYLESLPCTRQRPK
jgi:hypothetical protein